METDHSKDLEEIVDDLYEWSDFVVHALYEVARKRSVGESIDEETANI